jgi:putative membrane protein
MPQRRLPVVLLFVVLVAFVVLGWAPKADRFTWFMENLPLFIGLPALVLTHRKFPLTSLLYVLMALHALVLMGGGHWTYAEVPAGHWVRQALHLARNPYDRLGHLFQGFMPVLLFREVLFRVGALRRGPWAVMALILMVLGVSAAYELLEWQTAVWTGSSADAFLGTQGDPWDTQWDMACALMGAVAGLLSLSRLQDRQMARLTPNAEA